MQLLLPVGQHDRAACASAPVRAEEIDKATTWRKRRCSAVPTTYVVVDSHRVPGITALTAENQSSIKSS